jgi:uncharacterized spore protein YtfJ
MRADEVLSTAKEAFTAKRVYGEPYEKDGVTVIPAVAMGGGLGGGSGRDEGGQEGEGGGFGLAARPAGAYVIRNGNVSWQPAVDVNRIIVTMGVVAAVYLLMRPRVVRARADASR